ncbi:MAG: efflux RND transporter periplasmic adaptor subunit [Acidobacteria bacterium]|nr:efflux RND transporter periplasmic adaptor subunit [Acidobacteriota bacterium]
MNMNRCATRIAAATLLAGLFLFIIQACAPGKREGGGGPSEETVTNSEVSLGAEAVRTAGIQTAAVERRTFLTSVKATGSVSFNRKKYVRVSPRVAGRVERVLALPGDRVAAGQVLFELFSPGLMAVEAEYVQIHGRVTGASRVRTAEDAALDAELLASTETKLRLLGFEEPDFASLRSARVPLPTFGVRAPIAGTIVETEVLPGSAVEAGSCLAELADLSTLWVLADIYEKDLAAVVPGAKAEIAVAAYPGEVFAGSLTQVGSVMDEQTRTVKCRLEVGNLAGRLKPGMFAEVRIFASGKIAFLAVPEEAVRTAEGKAVVFVETAAGRYAWRAVETGRAAEGFVEILKGLSAGERVVTAGSFDVKAEMLKGTLEGEK